MGERMSIYKKTIGLTGFITILSFVVCLVLHYLFMSEEAEFWCNVVLGIFSGALLTLLSSVIGYRVERKRVLENFFYYTNKILKQINQYQMNMTLEEKIDLLLEYADSDKIEWDSCLGEIDFLFDFGKKNYKYIYNSIYKPLWELQVAIQKHYWHFKWYKDGTGKNDKVMEEFLKEIEPLILDREEMKTPIETDQNGKAIKYLTATAVTNRIVSSTNKELTGKYYTLMYGKKAEKQM